MNIELLFQKCKRKYNLDFDINGFAGLPKKLVNIKMELLSLSVSKYNKQTGANLPKSFKLHRDLIGI